jgi:hypothetical protein
MYSILSPSFFFPRAWTVTDRSIHVRSLG